MPHFDLCIIGAGSGGLTVAAAAAQFGRKVALIEKGKMGGDCLNYGCIPSKALIAAAKRAHAFSSSAEFGIAGTKPTIDFQRVHDHVHEVIAAIAPNDSQERFEKLGVTVMRATARFRDATTIEAGGRSITARRFVIATGSSPSIPDIPGLAEVPYLTNETLFDNTELPEHLIVIGGGPIGIEMAQAHRRLGAQVSVLEAFVPLAKDDPELAELLMARLKDEGIAVLPWSEITRVHQTSHGIAVDVTANGQARALVGSHLLVAAGRKPNVAELNLEAAGIAYTKRGITVDAGLRTSNRRAYAIGDVVGGLQFTHVANYHAGLVIRNALFRLPVKNRTELIPWVTYAAPELAHVGLSLEAAREKHGDKITSLRWPFAENDRAQTERRTEGLIKVVVGKRGRILGASILGANAGELIAAWSHAIGKGIKLKDLTGPIIPYPTLAEINKRVAISYYAGLATKPLVRRVIDVLGWLDR